MEQPQLLQVRCVVEADHRSQMLDLVERFDEPLMDSLGRGVGVDEFRVATL